MSGTTIHISGWLREVLSHHVFCCFDRSDKFVLSLVTQTLIPLLYCILLVESNQDSQSEDIYFHFVDFMQYKPNIVQARNMWKIFSPVPSKKLVTREIWDKLSVYFSIFVWQKWTKTPILPNCQSDICNCKFYQSKIER